MVVLRAIYNLQRFSILQSAKCANETLRLDLARVFAWANDLYPLNFETEIERELEECFQIRKETVKEILVKADGHFMSGNNLTFYEYQSFYEREVNRTHPIDRAILITAFRFLHLGRHFDEKFWKKLLEGQAAPMEAHLIDKDFSLDDIEL